MSRYLVTGVAGFIGNKVAELLLADGHTVIGVDNLNDAYDVRLKQWRLAQVHDIPGFTFQHIDIVNYNAVNDLWEKFGKQPFDAVINLAARAGVRQSVENPWVYVDTNVTGTLNLLEQCKKHDVSKFVLASTSSLYGSKNPRPFSESANTDGPLSPYAASKKGAEAICHSYHHLCGIDVSVMRYFTVYGPAGRPDMSVFRFIQWISEERPLTLYGDGSQERDFTYVDDIARGTIAAAQKSVGYEIINLGSDTPIVLIDVIHMIEKMVGKSAIIDRQPFHKADMMATWADISKAEQLLGWHPQVSFEAGVEASVDWYQTNREWTKDILTD